MHVYSRNNTTKTGTLEQVRIGAGVEPAILQTSKEIGPSSILAVSTLFPGPGKYDQHLEYRLYRQTDLGVDIGIAKDTTKRMEPETVKTAKLTGSVEGC